MDWQAVSTVGFPIFACVWLALWTKGRLDREETTRNKKEEEMKVAMDAKELELRTERDQSRIDREQARAEREQSLSVLTSLAKQVEIMGDRMERVENILTSKEVVKDEGANKKTA